MLESDDLLIGLAEIELEIVPFGPGTVRRAQHVGQGEKRMIGRYRLLLIDVDGGKTGAPQAQSREQRARLDELGAARDQMFAAKVDVEARKKLLHELASREAFNNRNIVQRGRSN